jgi:hypothetical protein
VNINRRWDYVVEWRDVEGEHIARFATEPPATRRYHQLRDVRGNRMVTLTKKPRVKETT